MFELTEIGPLRMSATRWRRGVWFYGELGRHRCELASSSGKRRRPSRASRRRRTTSPTSERRGAGSTARQDPIRRPSESGRSSQRQGVGKVRRSRREGGKLCHKWFGICVFMFRGCSRSCLAPLGAMELACGVWALANSSSHLASLATKHIDGWFRSLPPRPSHHSTQMFAKRIEPRSREALSHLDGISKLAVYLFCAASCEVRDRLTLYSKSVISRILLRAHRQCSSEGRWIAQPEGSNDPVGYGRTSPLAPPSLHALVGVGVCSTCRFAFVPQGILGCLESRD